MWLFADRTNFIFLVSVSLRRWQELYIYIIFVDSQMDFRLTKYGNELFKIYTLEQVKNVALLGNVSHGPKKLNLAELVHLRTVSFCVKIVSAAVFLGNTALTFDTTKKCETHK